MYFNLNFLIDLLNVFLNFPNDGEGKLFNNRWTKQASVRLIKINT